MRIEATVLRDAIEAGLRSVLFHSVRMTGERGMVPRPEYLTTASICFSLCDFADKNKLPLKIRSEEQTAQVWGKGLVKSFLSKRIRDVKWRARLRTRKSKRQRNASRNGNVDIALFAAHAFEHPFAVVENKGLLDFTSDGNLYLGSRRELEKDLNRNVEFVLRNGSAGGVQYSAFTFYLTDQLSLLKSEGQQFIAAKTSYFEQFLASLNLPPALGTNVHIATFDDDLYQSTVDAEECDEKGAPASDMHPPWHTLYGVISIYREGDEVCDALRLQGQGFA